MGTPTPLCHQKLGAQVCMQPLVWGFGATVGRSYASGATHGPRPSTRAAEACSARASGVGTRDRACVQQHLRPARFLPFFTLCIKKNTSTFESAPIQYTRQQGCCSAPPPKCQPSPASLSVDVHEIGGRCGGRVLLCAFKLDDDDAIKPRVDVVAIAVAHSLMPGFLPE